MISNSSGGTQHQSYRLYLSNIKIPSVKAKTHNGKLIY